MIVWEIDDHSILNGYCLGWIDHVDAADRYAIVAVIRDELLELASGCYYAVTEQDMR
jgi:hypothetical protein